MVVIEKHRGVNIVRTSKWFAFIWDGFVKTCDSIAGARAGLDEMKGDKMNIETIVAAIDADILEGCDMGQVRAELAVTLEAAGFEGVADGPAGLGGQGRRAGGARGRRSIIARNS